jgi:hypothetical protein
VVWECLTAVSFQTFMFGWWIKSKKKRIASILMNSKTEWYFLFTIIEKLTRVTPIGETINRHEVECHLTIKHRKISNSLQVLGRLRLNFLTIRKLLTCQPFWFRKSKTFIWTDFYKP